MKKEKGITLIALAITIVVLLILAGVTIVGITGENGIIGNAKEAKKQSEIGAEKEIIDVSVVQAIGDNKRGILEKIEYENILKKNSKKEPTNVFEDGEFLITEFVNKNRFYQVDKEGNVEGPIKKIEDEFAGDITKGGSCDGTQEKPYEINCIEDLVAFSKNVNEGNDYSNKTIILKRTLDFNSIFSYNDSKSTKYGDLNTNGIIEDIKTELTNRAEGCIGFTPIGESSDNIKARLFDSKIDGRNNEIRNLYVNIEGNAGLIGGCMRCMIRNLGVTGDIISSNEYAGGIVANGAATNYYNCYNKANAKGNKNTGGIVGHAGWMSGIMDNCYNEGKIISVNNNTGGLAGRYAGKIINCENKGSVISNGYTGGIVGVSDGTSNSINCINFGNLEGTWQVGGIVGEEYTNKAYIDNCYNMGELYLSKEAVSYSGVKGLGGNVIRNSYSFGRLTVKPGIAINNVTCKVMGGNTHDKCYYDSTLVPKGVFIENGLIDIKGKSMQEVVNMLNSYRDETGKYPEGWRKWKIGENGYPSFE